MAQLVYTVTLTRWTILRVFVPAAIAAMRDAGLARNPRAWAAVARAGLGILFGGAR